MSAWVGLEVKKTFFFFGLKKIKNKLFGLRGNSQIFREKMRVFHQKGESFPSKMRDFSIKNEMFQSIYYSLSVMK